MNAQTRIYASGTAAIAIATAYCPPGWTVIEGGSETLENAPTPTPDVLPDDADTPDVTLPDPGDADDDAPVDEPDAGETAEIYTPPLPSAIGDFIAHRASVGPAIAAISRVVERRNTLPILANVMLQASGGVLVITGTDLDIQLSAMIECKAGDFSATLPCDLLNSILKKGTTTDEVGFRASPDGDGVKMILGSNLKYDLKPLPVADFPVLNLSDVTHRFSMPGEAFRNMLETVSPAISTEETRYYLNGICFDVPEYGAPELRAVATDGHRCYRLSHALPDGAAGLPKIIVPRKTVAMFLKLTAGKKACPETVSIEVSESKIRFCFGDFEMVSKLIDGTYPGYQRVIPTGNDLFGRFNKAAFADALDSVTVISSERGRAVKLTVDDGKAEFTVTNPDSGRATMEIPATLEKDGQNSPFIEIGFNANYLKSILEDFGDADEFMIDFGDAGSPTIFRSAARPEFLACLMPMRV